MVELSEKKKGIEELLEKIPPERRWEITAQALTRLTILRGDKVIAPTLGKEEGVFAPVLGSEIWEEINDKVYGEGGRKMYPIVKETFNIPVEDAIDAAKLAYVIVKLQSGPEWETEIVETTSERAVLRYNKCPWWERYEEHEISFEHRACHAAHSAVGEEGLKTVSPKLTCILTKAMPWGNPFCEELLEFKEE